MILYSLQKLVNIKQNKMAGLPQALVTFTTEIICQADYHLFSESIITSLSFSSEVILKQLFVSDVHVTVYCKVFFSDTEIQN